jgi:hypothetical protein
MIQDRSARTPSLTIEARLSCLSTIVPAERLRLTRARVNVTPVKARSMEEWVLVKTR